MLGVLGDEWTLLIVQQALLGARRYAEFAAALPISSAVLTSRLQSMVGDELLIRREYQTRPSRSEYLTTARSRALWWCGNAAAFLAHMHHVHTCCGLYTQTSCTSHKA